MFHFYFQLNAKDCGPICLRMIAKHYGKEYSLQTLRERSYITREGVSMLGVSEAAESIGFRTIGVRITLKQLQEDTPLDFTVKDMASILQVNESSVRRYMSLVCKEAGLAVGGKEEFKQLIDKIKGE